MTWVRSARVDGFLRCILTISFLSLCVSCGGSASDTNDLGTSADMVGIDQAGSDTGRSCIPNCAFKQCGDDGCGGSCGVCGDGLSCSEEGYCAVNCIPDCAGRDCGDDGCGGSCGFCDLGTACSDAGLCTESCIPDCTGKHCGADGCGGSCGSCAEGLECDDQFRCVESCTPDCTDRTCGDDGCAGSCGDCAEGLECTDQGVCDVPCVPDCAGKQCGADGCGSFCGECLPGLVCDGAGLCEPAPPSPYGGPCHITADCQPFVVNPDTGGIAMNPAWPVCLNGQCADDGDQCLAPFGVPVCVRSCSVTKDDINNASGEAGPDLIDDPDVTGSVCEGADSTVFEGSWSCVNISDPGTIFGLCMPGEDFRPCDNSTDCSVDETCQVLSIAGTIEARCLPHIQDTAVNVVSLGEVCEVNVFTPAVFWAAEEAFCDTQLCIGSGIGCSAFCISDDDCLTAGASACVGGSCSNNPDQSCTTAGDCSSYSCTTVTLSPTHGYNDDICYPKSCTKDSDCPDADFFCGMFLNAATDPQAVGWENLCLPRPPDTVGLGEACNSYPATGNPGPLCENPNWCDHGYCGTLCDSDSDCATEKGQVCATTEIALNLDDEAGTDAYLPTGSCETFPHEGVAFTSCTKDADCAAPDSVCAAYLTPPNSGAMSVERVCTKPGALAGYGEMCGSGVQMDCASRICLLNDIQGLELPACSRLCDTAADCDAVTFGPQLLTTACSSIRLGFNGTMATEDDIRLPVCVPIDQTSSITSCAGAGPATGDPTVCPAGEYCVAFPIVTDLADAGTIDARCITNEESATNGLGDSCSDDEECLGGYCQLGQCSQLCDPAKPEPCGTSGLGCMLGSALERSGGAGDVQAWFCMSP